MGIVSSIGNTTQEVLASLHEARSPAFPSAPTATPNSAFAVRSMACRTIDPAESLVDRRAMRFHGGGTAWNHIAMDQAIARFAGLEAERGLQRAHRHHHGFGRSVDPHDRGVGAEGSSPSRLVDKKVRAASVPLRCRRRCRQRRRRRWPPGSRSRASTIPSRQRAPPRTTASATPMRRSSMASRTVIFAGGCEDLDWTLVGAVRRHGRDVVEI